MKRISSRATFYTKRLFPAIWFGFLAVWTVGAALTTFVPFSKHRSVAELIDRVDAARAR